MAPIGVKIGVEARIGGDFKLFCRKDGGEAQWAFGGNMYAVGPLAFPVVFEALVDGKAEFQLGIARDGAARYEVFVEERIGGLVIRGLPGTEDLNPMSAFGNAADGAVQGASYSIDLRREGFSDEGVVHGRAVKRRLSWPHR